MPLINFGSILNFAEELERQALEFYRSAAENPACGAYRATFERFVAEAQKNIQTVQRTRRENVTEMILESIRDFTRAPFCTECGDAPSMTSERTLATARRLEERAEHYYRQAAEKIKALSEVARTLKTLGKKHTQRIKQLDTL
jgi:rubrerythrin